MSKEKKLPKEYAIVVSLMIFFAVVTIVGSVRLWLVTSNSFNSVDLAEVEILEQDTNIDIESYNLRIINTIKDAYGIDVYYGDKLNVESVGAVPLNNEQQVFNMLKEVVETLSKYPRNLFKEIESKEYSVAIYLVDYFTINVEALANRNTIGQFKIYMSDTTNLERALHHENYHILDYYIKLEADEGLAYIDWSKYNPKGYTYPQNVDSITAKYTYNGEPGANFVTMYAKCSQKEDRAETFAEMIMADRNEIFFNDGEPIKGKIDIIREVLEDTFVTVRNSNNLAWK